MYNKRHKYTEEGLRFHALEDLRTDYRCAIQDGHLAYAEKCKREIEMLENGETPEDYKDLLTPQGT